MTRADVLGAAVPRMASDAMRRASYYLYMARRSAPLPGNDPLSGEPRGWFHRHEGRTAYKAMARYWLSVARRARS